jgi:hypothetical protein
MRRAHGLPTNSPADRAARNARCIVGLNVWAALGRVKHCAILIHKVYQAVIRSLPGRATRIQEKIELAGDYLKSLSTDISGFCRVFPTLDRIPQRLADRLLGAVHLGGPAEV